MDPLYSIARTDSQYEITAYVSHQGRLAAKDERHDLDGRSFTGDSLLECVEYLQTHLHERRAIYLSGRDLREEEYQRLAGRYFINPDDIRGISRFGLRRLSTYLKLNYTMPTRTLGRILWYVDSYIGEVYKEDVTTHMIEALQGDW